MLKVNLSGYRSRFRAAGIHLLISLLVATLAALLVFFVWYPGAYRKFSGGQELFTILVCVDVILGPLLTFAVFSSRKPRRELLLDIGLIALLQMGALVYGLWTVYQARPVFLIHEIDRFQVVTAADIDPLDLKQALPEYRELPVWGIQVVGVRQAVNDKERLTSLDLALAGKDVAMRPSWWQPLNESHNTIMRERGKSLESLTVRQGYNVEEVSRLLEVEGVVREDVLCFPVVSRRADWTVLINKNSMQVIGFVEIDGF